MLAALSVEMVASSWITDARAMCSVEASVSRSPSFSACFEADVH